MRRKHHRPGLLSRIRRRVKQKKASKPTLDYILTILGDPCVYCGEGGCDSIDHIIPYSRRNELTTGYGPDHWSNLAACHKTCNENKGSNGVIQFIMEQL